MKQHAMIFPNKNKGEDLFNKRRQAMVWGLENGFKIQKMKYAFKIMKNISKL